MAIAVAGGNVSANRLAQNLVLGEHRSAVEPDLQRLVGRLGPRAQAQPVENNQEGLSRDRMLFDSEGRVGIRVTAEDPKALVPALTAQGFQIQSIAQDLHLVEGFIPIPRIPALTALAPQGLRGVLAIPKPMVAVGEVDSQGDFVHEADRLRKSMGGLNGAGLRIGVISDSYDRLAGATRGVLNGDLPNDPNVVFLEGPLTGSDEGRAMTEIVHDVAPGAEKRFGSAFYGEGAFGDLITDLANPAKGDCDIIVDDIFYFDEPMFQDGVIAQGVDAAVNQFGRAYFSLAGNLSSQSYESTNFSPVVVAGLAKQFHDFDPSPGVDVRQRISLDPGQSIILTLQWDDPFYTTTGVDTDLDLILVRAGTNTVVASSTLDNIATGVPSERFNFTNFSASPQQYEILIQLWAGSVPNRIKYVNYGANNYGEMSILEYATNSSTVIPHSAAQGALSVGAINYDDQSSPASFTSAGPSTLLFSASGMPQSQPTTRAKPDIAAIQGANTSFFGFDADGDGFPNFYGTSAAAPHAAAIAALVWQNNPGLTPAQLYGRLISTADDSINGPGWDKLSGRGLVNAYDAIFGPSNAVDLPFAEGFESGVLSQAFETRAFGAGRIQVTNSDGPATGANHVLLTTSHDGRSGRSEVILHVNAAGLTGAVLTFNEREFNDADQPMSASFQGSENTDGVALSVDGVNWYRIASFTGSDSTNNYQLRRYSLAAVAAANRLVLGPDTRIKFQQFGNLKTPRGGIAIDDVAVLNMAGVSFGNTSYSVNESAGVANVTVLRTGDATQPSQVDFATADGTASTPADYASMSGTLLFQAGETEKTISIPLASDRLIEGPETVTLTLTNVSSGVLLAPSTVTLTIEDDQGVVAPSNLIATTTGATSVRLEWTDHSNNESQFDIERKVGVGPFTPLATVLAQVTSYVDSGLSINTLYTYRVRATQGSANSNYSNSVSVNISPIELQAASYTVSEDAGQVVVRLTRAGDILTTATVQLSTVDGSATGLDYTAQSLSVNFVRGETTKDILIPITADHFLEPNETFDVVLSNAAGGSATLGDQRKATVTITNGGAVPAPSNLAASVMGSTQVRLTWTDNCANETAFEVERRTGQGGFVPLNAVVSNSETYTDTSVVAGTVYTYRVRATQGGLESNYSNEVSTAVTSLQFEAASYSVLEDNGTVTLKVTRSGDPSLPVSVKYATSDGTAAAGAGDYVTGNGTLVFAPAETTKTITINVSDDNRLEGQETFNVTLSSPTGAGTVVGTPGTSVVTITDNQVRLTPTNLSAVVLSGSEVRLNWTDNSGNETGFEIERRPQGGAFVKLGETAANGVLYSDTQLTADTAYTYRVRAVSAAGASGYSNEAGITTLPAAPQAPANLAAVVQDGGKVRLTWSDNSLNESGFVLERKDGGSAFGIIATVGDNSTNYMDTGRTAGTTYIYRVRAVNAGGESANSNEVTVSLDSLPGSPSALTATAVSNVAIRLDWTLGSNSSATKIERQTDTGFVVVGTVAQGVNTFTDQGVLPNVIYTYRVRASSLTGDSEPTDTVQAVISALGRIKVTPVKLAFGRGKGGAERVKTITIKNTGTGTLGGAISGLSQTGGANGPFAIVSGGEPFTLARGQARKVTVRFLAGDPGNFQGVLTITSTDPKHGITTVSLSAATK